MYVVMYADRSLFLYMFNHICYHMEIVCKLLLNTHEATCIKSNYTRVVGNEKRLDKRLTEVLQTSQTCFITQTSITFIGKQYILT